MYLSALSDDQRSRLIVQLDAPRAATSPVKKLHVFEIQLIDFKFKKIQKNSKKLKKFLKIRKFISFKI